MLNKSQFEKELSKFILSHRYNPCDILVSHGGACVMHCVRETTNDIDVMVSLEIWEDQIAKTKLSPKHLGDGIWLLPVTDHIDIHYGCCKLRDTLTHDGVGFVYTTLEQTLDDYIQLNREKDRDTILMLKELV